MELRSSAEASRPYRAGFVAIGDVCGYQSSTLTPTALLPPECRHTRRCVWACHWSRRSERICNIALRTHPRLRIRGDGSVLHGAQCDSGGEWRMGLSENSSTEEHLFCFSFALVRS